MKLKRLKRKYALCVGLNYPGTSAALAGCVNDAHDWAAALRGLGYEVTVLLEPTKAQLVEALTALIAGARFGDRVVFTYSGHGTNLPDRNGDETDGRDEALVLADYRRGGILVDDELNTLFARARYGVRRTIISDSCHSGSVHRFAGSEQAVEGTPRFLPAESFQHDLTLEREVRASAPRTANPNVVLLSGSADNEYAWDAWFTTPSGQRRANGAFTRAAIDTLQATSSMKTWHAAVRRQLPSSRYPQTPQKAAARHQDYWAL